LKKLVLIFAFSFSNLFGFFDEVESFEASFSQIVNSDGQDILYKGELYIQKPSSVVWIYREPIKKEIYIGGKSLVVVEPDLEQVIIKSLKDTLNMLSIIEKSTQLSKDRYIATLKDKKYLLILKDGLLQRVIYEDELENGVEISFSNQKVNGNISKDIFQPKIPDYFDRIYQ
jgi:outer membrane lipoprotein carrier protein